MILHAYCIQSVANYFRSICRFSVFLDISSHDLQTVPAQSFDYTWYTLSSNETLSNYNEWYFMLFLILDIYHFFAMFALANVAATVSLMQINAIYREMFMTIRAFLCFWFYVHIQLLFKLQTTSINYVHIHFD